MFEGRACFVVLVWGVEEAGGAFVAGVVDGGFAFSGDGAETKAVVGGAGVGLGVVDYVDEGGG